MWKRYRGGRTTPIWLADLATSRVERVPRDNSNDYRPMWAAGKVWFLSDREGPVTLFSYDPGTKRVARAVENRGMDFKSASAASDAIVIEQFGGLHLYDLKSGRLDAVSISVSGDLEEVRERFVKVATRLTNASISPSGVRAVFEGRGEIITVPEEKGDARNLTNTPGVMERNPAWSPDGASVAYFSDESGEYALHIAPQDGRSAPRKIALGEPTILPFSAMVARQQEARVHGRAPVALVRGPGLGQASQGRQGPLLRASRPGARRGRRIRNGSPTRHASTTT